METVYGKITTAVVTSQDGKLGFYFYLSGQGRSVSEFWPLVPGDWLHPPSGRPVGEALYQLMQDARTVYFNGLVGKPVVMIFGDTGLVSWRILSEVL
jgi:hypothetical protein